MRVSALPALLGLAFLGSAGCDDGSLGDLLVHYQLGSGGPAETCAAFAVQGIRVTVDNSEREPLVEEALCNDARPEVLIRQLPADVYTVTVEGIDAEGNVAYRGEQADVRVTSDTVTETRNIAIAVLPPGLRLIWGFSDGMMCAPHNVTEVQVVAWLGGNARAYDEVHDCATGLVEIELMPGTYDLRVRAIDEASQDYAFAWDREDLVLEPGGGIMQVVASLEPCGEGGCSAP
jgi:hypothetical protein